MECIYIANLSENSKRLLVPFDEARHLKALHLQTGDKVMVTNGMGCVAITELERTSKTEYIANVQETMLNYGELPHKVALAIGILDDKSRFEFVLEKCVELGVCEIFPLILDFSQKKEINRERSQAKMIAAVKQCKRACVPYLHPEQTLDQLFSPDGVYHRYDNLILADEKGSAPCRLEGNSILFVGCEGGFSNRELTLFPNNVVSYTLGSRRLRAETAAIVALTFFCV